jgi:hypothetical protein
MTRRQWHPQLAAATAVDMMQTGTGERRLTDSNAHYLLTLVITTGVKPVSTDMPIQSVVNILWWLSRF